MAENDNETVVVRRRSELIKVTEAADRNAQTASSGSQ